MDTTNNDKTFDKNHYIDLFKQAGFNCFPLVRYRQGEVNTKRADTRYQARRTPRDLPILEHENYGVMGTIENKGGVLDIDEKEKYRLFAEKTAKTYMVIESGGGWHIPIKNFSEQTSKIELFDYHTSEDKVAEFQGIDHYVVGCGSTIWHEKLQREVTYTNIGTEKIWDARGKDFNAWIDVIARELGLSPRKKKNTSSYAHLRENFRKGVIPHSGQSNDYFHQATLVCMEDELTVNEAIDKIKKIYDEWAKSEYYSHRTWTSVQSKIEYTFEHDVPPSQNKGGRPKGSKENGIDTTKIAQSIIAAKDLYSNLQTENLFINRNGFLERYEEDLARELIQIFPELEPANENSILFKLLRMSPAIPETNDDYFVFKDGVRSLSTKEKVETDEIGSMGFKDYNYLSPTKENEPKKFLEVFFGNIPESEHKRVKASLRSILLSEPDTRISLLVGGAGSGKTKSAEILEYVLGDEYAYSVTVSQFINDHFIRAHIDGKRLLIFQDMPDTWKDFEIIKTLTGENSTTQRGFHQDKKKVVNRLKVMGCANYLAKIPADEKNPMYSRRLSLLHKDPPLIPYKENPNLSKEIADEEGEKIISWIFNLKEEDCEYEDAKTVKVEYEKLSSPETEFLEENYEFMADSIDSMGVITILKEFNKKYGLEKDMDYMAKALKTAGYNVTYSGSIVKNIVKKIKKEEPKDKPQRRFQSDDD
uniref:ORF35 n=1 Tax=Nitrosopumilaceae spindle-shaped virus TaxID=3065433 RepID=A0AAT9J7A3_9VIRU